ncbi:MAG: dihydrodipicolinate synthase family protein [Burkholderiales bacterium]
MPLVLKGVMQAPVTPFKDDFSLDLETLEKATDFHVRTGATGITWPYHKSESLNMTIAERKAGAEAVVKTVAGRVPVAIHVSALAVNDSLELARHAQKAGADCLIAITPYFWRVSPQDIYDYFVWLGTSVDLPLLAYNSPGYLAGVEITPDLLARLIERLPNFIGLKEASFNSERFVALSHCGHSMRPDFALLTGVEFLLPSIAFGGMGSSSSAGAICPNLVYELYRSCVAGEWPKARECQYKIDRLWSIFRDQYPSSLKGGMVLMGRPVGPTRPPLPTASKERIDYIGKQLEELGVYATEPHGW